MATTKTAAELAREKADREAEAERQRVERERAEVRRLARDLAGELDGTLTALNAIADGISADFKGISSDIAASHMRSMTETTRKFKAQLESV